MKGNASYIFPACLWQDANMEIGGILIGNLFLELPKEEVEANHTTLSFGIVMMILVLTVESYGSNPV